MSTDYGKHLSSVTRGASIYVLVVAAIPAISLVIAGLVWVWQSGYVLYLLGSWIVVSVLAWFIFVWQPQRRLRSDIEEPSDELSAALPDTLNPRPGWTTKDRSVHESVQTLINADLQGPISLDWLRTRATEVVTFVAGEYHQDRRHNTLAFTLPEGLLMVSVVSTRYRELVLTHIPFADRIKLASVFGIAQQRDRIQTGATWLNRVWRGARLINPTSAILSEARDHLTQRVVSQASTALQRDLVRLLLQEVAHVAIDLYGGHLSSTDQEVASHRSSASIKDEDRLAVALEPLRVVLIGQSNAGKSSLINALTDELSAEVDVLPATDQQEVHALTIPTGDTMHLVDTRGLDGSDDTHAQALEALTDADLILWVAKATQPGRAPDARAFTAWQTLLEDEPQRRAAPIALVLTNIDQLPPREAWSPPYPLDDSNNARAATIVKALESTRGSIGLDEEVPCIPVRLDSGNHYNIEVVTDAIDELAEEASQTQLNRRRRERSQSSGGWRKRLSQTRNLAVGLGQRVVKR